MAKRGGGKRKSGRGHKVRVDIRRNKQTRARDQNLTHDLLSDEVAAEDAESSERLGRVSADAHSGDDRSDRT